MAEVLKLQALYPAGPPALGTETSQNLSSCPIGGGEVWKGSPIHPAGTAADAVLFASKDVIPTIVSCQLVVDELPVLP
jgi:hypothetical protein